MIKTLDGTSDKSNLGANSILAVSLSVCKAGAAKKNMSLYMYIAELSGNNKVVMPIPAFN
ncbi:hypothetical protein A3Q56_08777, partial [Intoshia linei]